MDTIDKEPIVIERTKYLKCPRCWRYDATVGYDTGYKHNLSWFELCFRCASVMEEMYKSGDLKKRDEAVYLYRENNGEIKETPTT